MSVTNSAPHSDDQVGRHPRHGPRRPSCRSSKAASVEFWLGLSLNEHVGVVKTLHPDWTAARIAATLACSQKSVLRQPSYQRLRELEKAQQVRGAKYHNNRRLNPPDGDGFSNPDRPSA